MSGDAKEQQQPTTLGELIEELSQAGEEDGKVSVETLVQLVGRRSFGPILLLAGLIAVSPLSGIPGMPTTVATLVILVSVQFLLRRDHFWLPQWILRRRISHGKFCKALDVMRRPAQFVDKLIRPRLAIMTHQAGIYAIAILCIVIAATMPPLEILPFAATTAGAALTAFGLSAIAHDGVVGLIAILLTLGVAGIVIYSFL